VHVEHDLGARDETIAFLAINAGEEFDAHAARNQRFENVFAAVSVSGESIAGKPA
jgi:hypothetical protein